MEFGPPTGCVWRQWPADRGSLANKVGDTLKLKVAQRLMAGFAVTQATVKFRSQLKHNSYLKARRKVGLLASHFCGCLACTRKSLVKTLRLFGARCKWAQFPPTWSGKGWLAPVCPLAGKVLALQDPPGPPRPVLLVQTRWQGTGPSRPWSPRWRDASARTHRTRESARAAALVPASVTRATRGAGLTPPPCVLSPSPATQHHPVPRSCLAISSEAPQYI